MPGMKKMPARRDVGYSLAAAVLCAGTGSLNSCPAFAASDSSASDTLGEIIVTAQKREQNLQDVVHLRDGLRR